MSVWEHTIEIRPLDKKGYCHCCNKKIDRNDEKVIVLKKSKGQDYYYIMCFDCLNKINEVVSSGKTEGYWREETSFW